MRAYLDSAVIIYLVEKIEPFFSQSRSKLATPDQERVTSELSRMEVRIKPLRVGETELVKAFDIYFDAAFAEVAILSRDILEKAADLRAKYSWLKTPDAIHLAAAIESRCDVFLTNDHRLERCTEIKVEVLAA